MSEPENIWVDESEEWGSTTYIYSMEDVEILRQCKAHNTTVYGALECFRSLRPKENHRRLLHLWLPMLERMR